MRSLHVEGFTVAARSRSGASGVACSPRHEVRCGLRWGAAAACVQVGEIYLLTPADWESGIRSRAALLQASSRVRLWLH